MEFYNLSPEHTSTWSLEKMKGLLQFIAKLDLLIYEPTNFQLPKIEPELTANQIAAMARDFAMRVQGATTKSPYKPHGVLINLEAEPCFCYNFLKAVEDDLGIICVYPVRDEQGNFVKFREY
jgi:hypothetical protein